MSEVIEKAELQDILEFSVMGIVSQGGPSVTQSGGLVEPAYRDGRGRKCAIGHFIPDEDYHAGLESLSCGAPRVQDLLIACGIPIDQKLMNFLLRIQDTHDIPVRRLIAQGYKIEQLDPFFWDPFTTEIHFICRYAELEYPDHLM